jgi:NADH pyrophosphatase NudC (nudix superfamily)
MANPNKVEFKNAIITEENSQFRITTIDEVEGEVEVNLTDEIRKFVDMDNVNVKINKAKSGTKRERKPTYKFMCPNCGRIIKSNEEDLAVKCLKCNEDFIKQE